MLVQNCDKIYFFKICIWISTKKIFLYVRIIISRLTFILNHSWVKVCCLFIWTNLPNSIRFNHFANAIFWGIFIGDTEYLKCMYVRVWVRLSWALKIWAQNNQETTTNYIVQSRASALVFQRSEHYDIASEHYDIALGSDANLTFHDA